MTGYGETIRTPPRTWCLERLGPHDVWAARHEVVRLYAECYTPPPWSETPDQVERYRVNLAGAVGRPGFCAWAVHARGRLAGICYGWPTPPDLSGNRIYDAMIRALGPDRTVEITRGAFELAELFVTPDHRGLGLGRELLARTVAGLPSAWLITSPEAPASRLYRRSGWRHAADLPTGFHPRLPMAVLTLDSGRPVVPEEAATGRPVHG